MKESCVAAAHVWHGSRWCTGSLAVFDIADYATAESPLPPQRLSVAWLVAVRPHLVRMPYIRPSLIEPVARDLIKDHINNADVWEPRVVASIEQHVVPGNVTVHALAVRCSSNGHYPNPVARSGHELRQSTKPSATASSCKPVCLSPE